MEMKKIAFFDTKPYDKESFDRLNNGRYDIKYFETRLTSAALPLADGCDAACAFVNAEIDRAVVEGLVKRGSDARATTTSTSRRHTSPGLRSCAFRRTRHTPSLNTPPRS